MLRLVAWSISYAVLTKLPSVVCLFGLVGIRWLSLCSFGKALNVPGVTFIWNSCEISILLVDDVLSMMSLDSSL